MRTRPTALVLLALLAPLAAACDGDPTPPDAGPLDAGPRDAGPGGDLEADYCAPLAAWVCGAAEECGCGGVLPGGTLDVAACTERYTAECMGAWSGLASAVASGQARIRREAAAACITRLGSETAPCTRPSGVTTSANCEPFFTGPAALGEACSEIPICADGAGVCAEGTCVARRTTAESCASAFDCATGLICADGECRSPAGVGESCGEALPCGPPLQCLEGSCVGLGDGAASCASAASCAVGARCEGGACVPRESVACAEDGDCGNLSRCAPSRACAPRAAAGTECDRDEVCAAGHYCDDGSSTCTALPGVDEPCARGVLCAAGLGCDELAGSVCRTPGGAGAPCLSSERGPSVCADDLGCLAGDGLLACGPLGGEGSPCTVDLRCADGLGCAFEAEASVCRARRAVGETCENDATCASDLFCDFSVATCAQKRATGAPCSAGNECEGICAPDAGGGFSCAPRPTEGERCYFVDDCAGELACAEAAAGTCLDPVCEEAF